MKILKKLSYTFLISLSFGSAFSQNYLEEDSAIKKGILENGLTYYICKNNYPENQAGFYIVQKVGSVQEEDNQQGLAHFLEHMAFNGSKHFADDKMLRYLESYGIKFGAEINAYTSFDETLYFINGVPTNKTTNLIDSCLLILADWSGGILLEDKEIDKERGIIKSEAIMRSNAAMRMTERFIPKLLSNSKYAYRLPIGKMDIIENFKYDELRAYYKKWYHPNNQAIIIVGDIDPNYIENKIKEYFSIFTNPENAPKVIYPEIDDNEEAIFITDRDKEQQYSVIVIDFKKDIIPIELRNTAQGKMQSLIQDIISQIALERFMDFTKKPEAPFVYSYATFGSFVAKTKDCFEISAIAKEEQEYECFKWLYREAMRIQKHGFTTTELNRAKEEILSLAEKAYTNREKQENTSIAQKAQKNFLHNTPMLSPEQNYNLLKQMLPSITLDTINKAASKYISPTDKNLVVISLATEKEGAKYLTEEEMKKAVEDVRAENIEAFIDDVKMGDLVEKLPKQGKIKSETKDNFSGATIYTLSNGTKVYALKTDYKADEILFKAISWGGEGIYSDIDINNLKLCTDIIQNVGLGSYSAAQLNKKLSGIQINLNSFIDNREESLSGSCTPKDLDYLMQMIHLTYTNPGNNNDDYLAYMQKTETIVKNREKNPLTAYNDTINKLQYDNNPRKNSIVYDDLKSIDFKRIREIYCDRFADANNFTFYFVGNFEYDTLKTLLCKYIASLPKIKRNENYRRNLVDYHKGKIENTFSHNMETPQCRIYNSYTFRNVGTYNLEDDIIADAAAQILSMIYIKEIREDSSLVYNISAKSSFDKADNGLASSKFVISCPTKAEYGNLTQKIIDQILKRCAEQGFEKEKLDKVKEYFLKTHQANLKRNNYWLYIISEKQFYGFDQKTNFEEIVNNLTVKKIQDYFKKLLNAEGIVKVQIQPEDTEQKMKIDKGGL